MKIYRTVDGKLVRGVEVSQSRRRIASANRDEMNRRWEMWENLSEEKKQVLLDDYDVKNETDLEKALEMCDDSYLIEDNEDTYGIYSGCHGKSDKRRREKKEDELESSRRDINSSLAYNEGWDAYYDGVDIDDNPYDITSDEYIEWKKGWNLAYIKDPYSGAYIPNSRNARTLRKKEDELESSRRSVKSSPDMLLRNRAREIFRRFDELSPDYQEDILTRFDVEDEDDLADYVMAYGNASAIDELDDAVAKAESGINSSRNAVAFSKFNRISSLFIKNDRLVEGEECVIQIKDKNGRWEDVSYDREKPYWSIKGKPKMFSDEKTARKSALMKALNDAGYSEEAGNLQISMS